MNTTEPEILEPDPEPTTAVAVRESQPVATVNQEKALAPATPQQLRVTEVSDALAPAYARASMLQLTDDEVARLTAPFADDIVEIRPNDGLIYISHIFISDRLNQVLKPGQWSLVCRRHWIEKETMYAEYVLLVRGCFVGESVGGHPYVATNPKTNYSDTLESTAGEALRRIAGKRLSCGSQVWQPQYARNWVAKYSETYQGKNWKGQPVTLHRKKAVGAAPQAPATQPAPAQPTTTAPAAPATKPVAKPVVATQKTLDWFLGELKTYGSLARDYFVEAGVLLPNEEMTDFPLHRCPTTRATVDTIKKDIEEFHKSRQANPPEAPLAAPVAKLVSEVVQNVTKPKRPFTLKPGSDEPTCFDTIIPVPRKGQTRTDYVGHEDTIGSLYHAMKGGDTDAQHRLWGFAKNFVPTGWTKRTGEQMPPNDTDLAFRDALDEFCEWHESKHPDQGIVP